MGLRKRKVLIIDDNEVSRSMLRHILNSDQKYQVIGLAGNGSLGLQMIGRLLPDIVCLDVVMNGIDGLEVLTQIKQTWPGTTVLMVTGSKDAETVKNAQQNGADGYIVKPFNPATLLAAVEQALIRVRA
ncbi:MAG: response regulator transcription factor [Burkholderiales bacterium]|nr:response regulator transcription factor [Burkholderiales bacterium]